MGKMGYKITSSSILSLSSNNKFHINKIYRFIMIKFNFIVIKTIDNNQILLNLTQDNQMFFQGGQVVLSSRFFLYTSWMSATCSPGVPILEKYLYVLISLLQSRKSVIFNRRQILKNSSERALIYF